MKFSSFLWLTLGYTMGALSTTFFDVLEGTKPLSAMYGDMFGESVVWLLVGVGRMFWLVLERCSDKFQRFSSWLTR